MSRDTAKQKKLSYTFRFDPDLMSEVKSYLIKYENKTEFLEEAVRSELAKRKIYLPPNT